MLPGFVLDNGGGRPWRFNASDPYFAFVLPSRKQLKRKSLLLLPGLIKHRKKPQDNFFVHVVCLGVNLWQRVNAVFECNDDEPLEWHVRFDKSTALT